MLIALDALALYFGILCIALLFGILKGVIEVLSELPTPVILLVMAGAIALISMFGN